MKNFLDIPKMFKYLYGLSRGDVYRLLNCVIKNYERSWDLTLDQNSYEDIKRFVSLLKVYKIKHNVPKIDKYERRRKFVAHMFSTITRANAVTARVDSVVEKAENFMDKMNAIIDTSKSRFSC
jgi:hypothetical protein